MGRLINLKKNSYNSAKVSVRKGKLYGMEKIKKLVGFEFDEIMRYLEEHGFRKSVDKSYLQYQGFYLVERVLNDHLSKIYKSIFLGSSKENRFLLESYYLKYQVHNMMVILRCKKSKEEDFEAYLIGDSRRKAKYIKAWEMPDTDAIIYMSKKLGFNYDEVLEKYKLGIYEVENYLYKIYYEKLKNMKFVYNNSDEKIFAKFIQKYIDLLNARAYLRLKEEGSDKMDFSEIYLQGGKLKLSNFENLDSKSTSQTFEYLKDFFGVSDFSLDALTIDSLDRKISSHKKNAQNAFKKSRFGSPFYALKFLFEVEKEMSLLRIILKAKYLKVPEEEILKLIS